jgi:hypothetical protein
MTLVGGKIISEDNKWLPRPRTSICRWPGTLRLRFG